MATVIYINLNNSAATPAPSPWLDNDIYPAVTTAATIKADLLDDGANTTGISLTAVTGVTGAVSSSIVATSGAGGWPKEVFQTGWYFGASGETHTLGGLTNGDTYVIEVAGHASNASRDTNFTIGGTTTLYDNAGTGVPNAPISFSGTVSGTTLDIDMAMVSTFGYVNGYKITITPAASGPTTSNIVLNGEATHEVVQTMIAVANTTPGESIFGTDLIAVEDDMQAYIVKAANGMNITWAADGTFTTDADQTEIIDVAYFAPSTGQWSCLALTISASGVGATIPPASRTSVFHIAAALRALETFTHTQTNELVVEWLESEGISRTTLNGMLYGYLGGLGYTGSIEDRMKKWRNDA